MQMRQTDVAQNVDTKVFRRKNGVSAVDWDSCLLN